MVRDGDDRFFFVPLCLFLLRSSMWRWIAASGGVAVVAVLAWWRRKLLAAAGDKTPGALRAYDGWTTGRRVVEDFSGRCRGRTFLVTGAGSGLGLECVRLLVQHGARVVLGCRSADAVLGAVDGHYASQLVFVAPLDLASLASVQSAAAGGSALWVIQ
jgi:hypothetical protein